jgi:hypothetical protein
VQARGEAEVEQFDFVILLPLLGIATTSYAESVAPPLEEGAVKETVAEVFPAETEVKNGALGTMALTANVLETATAESY